MLFVRNGIADGSN